MSCKQKNGIDLTYSDKDFGAEGKNTGAVTTGGNDGGQLINGRLKLGIVLNTSARETSLIDRVTAITHESFLHVQEYSYDYKDNGIIDYSNDLFYNKLSNLDPIKRHHTMFHYKPGTTTNHPLATDGIRILESINNRYKLGYKRIELWEKIWNFWD